MAERCSDTAFRHQPATARRGGKRFAINVLLPGAASRSRKTGRKTAPLFGTTDRFSEGPGRRPGPGQTTIAFSFLSMWTKLAISSLLEARM